MCLQALSFTFATGSFHFGKAFCQALVDCSFTDAVAARTYECAFVDEPVKGDAQAPALPLCLHALLCKGATQRISKVDVACGALFYSAQSAAAGALKLFQHPSWDSFK